MPGDLVDVGPAQVRLAVNARARRIGLRIAADGSVVATAPSVRRLPQALAFAHDRAEWIAERLRIRPPRVPLAPGSLIPLRGAPVRLRVEPGRRAAHLEGSDLIAGGEGEGFSRRIQTWLRKQALSDLTAATALHARTLGRPVPEVRLTDARTRWGSCTPATGRIRYSWRLVLAPPKVLDYVAAHEVAHLAQADHSPAFWAVVAHLYGDPKRARAWLREHGATLHAVG
jgi:predicted metal-dependent hydrolase